MVACFLLGLLSPNEPSGKDAVFASLRPSASLCVSALSALKAFALSAPKMNQGLLCKEVVCGEAVHFPTSIFLPKKNRLVPSSDPHQSFASK